MKSAQLIKRLPLSWSRRNEALTPRAASNDLASGETSRQGSPSRVPPQPPRSRAAQYPEAPALRGTWWAVSSRGLRPAHAPLSWSTTARGRRSTLVSAAVEIRHPCRHRHRETERASCPAEVEGP